MKDWQFWLLFLALGSISVQVGFLASESTPLFKQVRWITWKLDQRRNKGRAFLFRFNVLLPCGIASYCRPQVRFAR